MKHMDLVMSLSIGATCLVFSGAGIASTIQTEGSGSAVTSVGRSATFDSMTSSNAVNLDTYAENGLSITTASTSWGEDPTLAPLDPFHGANGADHAFYAMANGSDTWVAIQATDSKKIFGVEFMYGNTWTTGDIYGPYPWGNNNAVVNWQTWSGGSMVSSGTIGGGPLLQMGTILGFYDPAGFDTLLVDATIPNYPGPYLQAIALDNLNVQLAPVPEPETYALMLTGLGFVGAMARRSKQAKARI